ncbi:hypothetical protein MBLNU459_g1729t1 [Dothideomycetes sp. NU459]
MPPTGLLALKTRAENRAQTETVQVYVIELPARFANNVLNFVKESIKDQDCVDLQHLRRFAKARFLPDHLLLDTSSPANGCARDEAARAASKSHSRSRSSRRRSTPPATLHLLICPVTLITVKNLKKALKAVSPFWEEAYPLNLRVVTVPLFAPTSAEQADEWSAKYWPTMYRKINPFGPHPTVLAKAEEEMSLDDGVTRFMVLAQRVAEETRSHACGENIGCVVVERTPEQPDEIIAVAGDGRYVSPNGACAGNPNIMSHAVMRAIGMVARKRVRSAAAEPDALDADMSALDINRPSSKPPAPGAPETVSRSLLDYPLTTLERNAFDKHNIIPNGYLCVDLEIYVTHEPCMMCSMAILHSRFSRCVFGERMPKTGALTADMGLGYGLFWRSELNWKLLCWEWKDPNLSQEALASQKETVDEAVQV